jgi:hypothetical protein
MQILTGIFLWSSKAALIVYVPSGRAPTVHGVAGSQHLWEVARKLYPNNEEKQKAWMKIHQKRLLDGGRIEKLVGALRSIESDNPEVMEKIRTEADYFGLNTERMRYPKFRRQHLFVGSGVIEAGCKTVVAFGLKRSGMFWTVRKAIDSTNSTATRAKLIPPSLSTSLSKSRAPSAHADLQPEFKRCYAGLKKLRESNGIPDNQPDQNGPKHVLDIGQM